MFKGINIFCVLLLLLHVSCKQATSSRKDEKVSVTKKIPITIEVQPFSDVSVEDINYVFAELSKVYPKIILNNSIPLPASAFYAARNRYRADSLISFLDKRTTDDHVTIGLTATDISTAKGNIADWGVMGLGFCPGKACIASTFRLSKNEKSIQPFKVAIHELGHTQGLPHCAVLYCFMRDAEGHNSTNEEKDFCTDCKKVLQQKGWAFN